MSENNDSTVFDINNYVQSKYICSLCKGILVDPLKGMCGHRFCHKCIKDWIGSGHGSCPIDHSAFETDLKVDEECLQEMMADIKCPNMITGCVEIVQIFTLKEHLVECLKVSVSCPHCQKSEFMKHNLADHIKNDCEMMPVECDQCMQFQPLKYMQSHKKHSCPYGEFKCFHCSKTMERYKAEHHIKKECQDVKILCCFSEFGCQIEVLRSEFLNHIEENRDSHNRMVYAMMQEHSRKRNIISNENDAENSDACLEKSNYLYPNQSSQNDPSLGESYQTIRNLERKLHYLTDDMSKMKLNFHNKLCDLEGRVCNGNFKWEIKNFNALKSEALNGNPRNLHSPSFYTTLNGYKLCVRVNIYITESKQHDPTISMFIHLMKGEFDDELYWPFRGSISMSIIHPTIGNSSIVRTMMADPSVLAFQRVPAEQEVARNIRGFGFREFTNVSELENKKLIVDNKISIHIKV